MDCVPRSKIIIFSLDITEHTSDYQLYRGRFLGCVAEILTIIVNYLYTDSNMHLLHGV